MKNQTLTFGAKIALTTGALAVVMTLLAAYGLHAIGTMDDAFSETASGTTRRLELAGILDAAEANMPVGQRGVILYGYAKEPANVATADRLFQESSSEFERSLAEIRPLLVSEHREKMSPPKSHNTT